MDSIPQPRYQFCPWWVRIWRRRQMLLVPHRAVIDYFRTLYVSITEDDPDAYMSFRTCWKLEVGLAHGRMNFVWTWDEVKNRLRARFGKLPDEDDNGEN